MELTILGSGGIEELQNLVVIPVDVKKQERKMVNFLERVLLYLLIQQMF